jgi:hypothetical protein
MTCHQIKEFPFSDLAARMTGNFEVAKPDAKGNLTINGPYEDVITHPMESFLSMTPTENNFIKTSEVCASCHTIHLPVVDDNNKILKYSFEQATYLEWVNSDFGYAGDEITTCQACHMSDHLNGKKAAPSPITNMQDQTFPAAEEISPLKDSTVAVRGPQRRHKLEGINLFGMEMFNQFPGVLRVNKTNFMTGWDTGLQVAINEANHTAANFTTKVKLSNETRNGRDIDADITVTNYTGHKFPSGVGFRRTFLEVRVTNNAGKTLLVSGDTDKDGRILGSDGKPLVSDIYNPDPNSVEVY